LRPVFPRFLYSMGGLLVSVIGCKLPASSVPFN
jgi:hypothetical protein